MSDEPGLDTTEAQISSIATLSEPLRRSLYQYVDAADHPVGREEAATAMGVAHHVAKFHLDRLAADGLLDVEYARPPGRGGPGAGRPAKLYRRTGREISVSIPERHYDLAGQVMAAAITAAGQGEPLHTALRASARAVGRDLAHPASDVPQQSSDRHDVPGGDTTPLNAVEAALLSHGYEPRHADRRLELANCPFHKLAQQHTALVCGINLDLIDGLLEALDAAPLRAELNPGAGRCCVTITI